MRHGTRQLKYRTIERAAANDIHGAGHRHALARAGVTAGILIFGAASRAFAQVTPPNPPPQITVSARGEVQVAPDRARVQVGVETQAKTAAVAAAENNKKQAAILAAIRALGVPATQITTLGYNVAPVQRYDQKLERVVIDGYQVSNIVQVTTDKLDQTGPIIDAGLTNGANRVAGLDFLVKDNSKARDAALTQAVESARRQADIAARSAGGTLGELIELNINEFERPDPRPMLAMSKMADASSAPTPISEGMNTVSVSVNTRWRYEKGIK